MRLARINNMEAANAFLPIYWKSHNTRFAIEPADPRDAHRALLPGHNLEKILCKKEYRKVSKSLEIQYKTIIYQVKMDKPIRGRHLIGAKVTVQENLKGEISIEYQGKLLKFQQYAHQEFQGEVIHSKEIDRFLKEKPQRKPPHYHILKKRRFNIKKQIQNAANSY